MPDDNLFSENAPIRVMIVDDHQVVRRGLISFLSTAAHIQVVIEASSGAEAVTLAEQHQPDVTLLDLLMPEMNGVEATAALRARVPHTRVIILSTFGEPQMVADALRAGAIGYLIKSAPLEQIIAAIEAAMHGSSTLSAEAAAALIKPPAQVRPSSIALKPREMEVLTLMCKGMTNPQIAAQLYLSRATVKYYVSEILTKLNLTTRTEAVAYAIENGLVTRD
jgi:NarL family two-component system response regulator LiaR